MIFNEILRNLRELRTTQNQVRVIQLADALRLACESPLGLDRVTFDEIAEAVRGQRLSFEVPYRPVQVGVGEAPLLLAGANQGLVSCLRALRVGEVGREGVEGRFNPAAEGALRVATEGLVYTLGELGCSRPRCEAETASRFEIPARCPSPARPVEGASLGLSACIARLSLWLGRAPASGVVASAAVGSKGELRAVGGLAIKLEATRVRWPSVERILVASEQRTESDLLNGIQLVRCHTLFEALQFVGLVPLPGELPLERVEQVEELIDRLPYITRREMDRAGWLIQATRALDLAAVARCAHGRLGGTVLLDRETTALGFAALFSLRGGDHEGAQRTLGMIPLDRQQSLDPEVRAAVAITRATAAIEGSPSTAQALAQHALAETSALPEGTLRRRLHGRALGTLGRAQMHAGDLSAALCSLQAAADYNAMAAPEEEARSLCYLAICKRLSGQLREALADIDRGLEQTARLASFYDALRVTRRYLLVERGRCLLRLGQLELAREAFECALPKTVGWHDHPEIAALRGLAQAHRRHGSVDASVGCLRRCLDLARGEPSGSIYGRVAALAAGEALEDLASGVPVGYSLREIESLWAQFHPGVSSSERAEYLLREIY